MATASGSEPTAPVEAAPGWSARLGSIGPAWLMVLASLLFATMSVCVKLASADYAPGEIILWRGAIGAVLILAVARSRRVSLATTMPMAHFWRSFTGVIAMFCWFYALGSLPLATAMTLNYMSPVWMALFLIGGAAMLGGSEAGGVNPASTAGRARSAIDGRLIGTVLLGFAGVALILRPTIERDQLWHGLIGLASGMISATAYLQITALARAGEPELRIVFYFSLGGIVFGLINALFTGLHEPSWHGAVLMLAIGALATIAQLLMTRAYKGGRVLVIASLQYLGILFSAAYGMLLFGDPLTWMGAAGMLVIFAAGLAATLLRSRSAPAEAAATANAALES